MGTATDLKTTDYTTDGENTTAGTPVDDQGNVDQEEEFEEETEEELED